ncbi:lytic transglycosylase domain-containing protein [Noviherbaspirillum cavernae]|uniref:Lytic transglycosylase domain-containing protein n=1 Tax=Noviherbaspirillum cavernae TaxID=2320862 RepID=A0A418WYZ8_9BURK|nr:lytic transglycosylase domain-containing protein [Noviherbaspirillum cavernae]RJG05422.1 lytic transglycosylase domain-containing protein [Noviherbaspirillum cavernae]
MRFVPLCIALSVGSVALPALADIYGYVDAGGVEHFSTEKLDGRYRLFMKGGMVFDSARAEPSSPGSPKKLPASQYFAQHPNLKKYEPLLHQAAQDFSLDPALLKAVMAAESGFNPSAVSPKGAVGLMQIMPATAERYGLQADRNRTLTQKLADPGINIRLAARYLRDLHDMFPLKPHLVIASYNAGEGAVQKYNNQIPPYPETVNYVKVVTQFYQLFKPSSDRVAVGASDVAVPVVKRIRMTIPGRSNMPTMTSE